VPKLCALIPKRYETEGACHVENQWCNRTRHVSPNTKIIGRKTTQN